jgi:hypothetical protein
MSWDVYNVTATHILTTLQGDAELGAGGSLEIVTWEQELRESADAYQDNELPAVAVSVDFSGEELVTIGDRMEFGYLATVMVTTTSGQLQDMMEQAKQIAARAERVLRQQHLPILQLSDLPADIDGADPGSVMVAIQSTQFGGGLVANKLRGAGVILAGIAIDIDIPTD